MKEAKKKHQNGAFATNKTHYYLQEEVNLP
jgi:hypothetical protein